MGPNSLEEAVPRFAAWLTSNQSAFSFRRSPRPIRQVALLKPFAEYVLCNELLMSYGIPGSDFAANLEWAWNELEHGDVLTRLLLARPDVFCVASVYAPLIRAGYRSDRLDNLLREIARLRSTQVVEIQTWMRLGFQHAMARIEGAGCDLQSARTTWLRAMPEPWCINDDIMYAVTHEVFYASDFGRSACQLPADLIAYLELWVPAWIRCYEDQQNWDLTAELIMVADCLPGFVWDRDPMPPLLMQQRKDGHIPGPVGAGGLLVDASETRQQATFFGLYHTTLVAAMAAGLRLLRRRALAVPNNPSSSKLQLSLERSSI